MRILIVSNRLPVTIQRKKENLKISSSSGGLVSGLTAYLDSLQSSESELHNFEGYVWCGWPGADIPEDQREKVTKEIVKQHNSTPVYISTEEMENFYQGFCNKTIWPLFHYFPSYVEFKEEYWESYISLNQKFCDSISNSVQPGDIIWVHDYHLMLLPQMLRERFPDTRIGFFLHIPFPAYEIFRLMPEHWRKNILHGLLGADLIGFHTSDYMLYFLRSLMRVLSINNTRGKIFYNNRMVTAGTFPMGIDYHKFHSALSSPEHLAEKAKLKNIGSYEKIILSMDRLDYTKGIVNRLEAYDIFLSENPGWKEKVVLLLQIIPSRIGVDKYEELKHQIDEQVGRINGKYGSLQWTPVIYRYGFVQFYPLTALYSLADIMLVTPLRDGMNLIAKEYIACREKRDGVLILSEMAGASKELNEAVLVNPNLKEEIAEVLQNAINMPLDEQVRRNCIMQEKLEQNNVINWVESFINNLQNK
jgi:trehalose 6-phosphate synthase/phosphatase